MANGDVAALNGFTPIAPTDDLRLGYDRINQLADLLMARTGTNAWSLAAITLAANWSTLQDPNGAASGTLAGGLKLAGGILYGSFQAIYTGATLTGDAAGNIADTAACTLAAGFRPSGRRYFPFYVLGVAIGSGRIGTNGLVEIVSVDPGATINNGRVVDFEFTVPM